MAKLKKIPVPGLNGVYVVKGLSRPGKKVKSLPVLTQRLTNTAGRTKNSGSTAQKQSR